ncbi:MAG: hypothetical protein LCI00_14210 [Chloroflexi bacterium]|nr:hypothetical protein [Chloroflexota bacterium]MCC6895067.1 hypothetical protein [Anaerolineae bacterium]
MNSLIEEELRDQLLDMLSDAELAYKLPGNNPTLGELCAEMGYVQQAYTQSFKTLKHDWVYRDSKPETPDSVASLKTWFKKLDVQLVEALSGLSESEIHTQQIDRGHGFTPSLHVQFQIYREAILIFYAKASIYLKALEKPYSDEWKGWVG